MTEQPTDADWSATTRAQRRAADHARATAARRADRGPRVLTLLPGRGAAWSARHLAVAGVVLTSLFGLAAGGAWAARSDVPSRGNTVGQSLADQEIDRLLADAAALAPPTQPTVVPLDPLTPEMPSPAPLSVVSSTGEERAVDPAALVTADVPSGAIPAPLLAAYRRAADAVDRTQPGCNLPWWLLAGIGKIESGHAAGGRVDGDGATRGRIVGPRLDGTTAGTAVLVDTDGGRLDGDATFDRAVGPMQFLPSTWSRWGADGNADRRADPHNVFDATLGAGRYLCASGLDLSTESGMRSAVLTYNQSSAYVADVLAWGRAYRDGVESVPAATGAIPTRSAVPQPASTSPVRTTRPTGVTTPTPATTTAPTRGASPSPTRTSPAPATSTPTVPPTVTTCPAPTTADPTTSTAPATTTTTTPPTTTPPTTTTTTAGSTGTGTSPTPTTDPPPCP